MSFVHLAGPEGNLDGQQLVTHLLHPGILSELGQHLLEDDMEVEGHQIGLNEGGVELAADKDQFEEVGDGVGEEGLVVGGVGEKDELLREHLHEHLDAIGLAYHLDEV